VTAISAHELNQLIQAHGAALVLYARQWCGWPDDAVQEAFVELMRQTRSPVNPVGWLYQTVRRRAMNVSRAERRRAKHHRQAQEESRPWFIAPEDTLDEPVDLEPLLAKLSRVDREIVVARVWGELSLEEIADLVELSTSTVHRRYHQSLARLHKMLENENDRTRAKA
jgi:RNA polymerase sigma-70 factor (ECF subfamily)